MKATLRQTLDSAVYFANSLGKTIVFKLSDDDICEIRQWCEFTPCSNPSSPRVGYYRGVEIYHEF